MRPDMLIREKPARLLLALRGAEQTNTPNTIMGLAKASGMSFVHASNLLNGLESDGVITSSKAGRTKRILLTQKGAEIANALDALLGKISAPPAKPSLPEQPTAPAAPLVSQRAEFPQPPEQSKKKLDELEEEKKE